MFNGWGWVFPVAGVVLAGFVFGDVLANAFGTALSRLRRPAPLRGSGPSGLQSHFAKEN